MACVENDQSMCRPTCFRKLTIFSKTESSAGVGVSFTMSRAERTMDAAIAVKSLRCSMNQAKPVLVDAGNAGMEVGAVSWANAQIIAMAKKLKMDNG